MIDRVIRAAILALALVPGGATVVRAETGDCPPVKQVALAFAEGVTADELLAFEGALATVLPRHCSAEARKQGRAWTAEASACVKKAVGPAAARACLDRAPSTLRAALEADAVASFPYSVVARGRELELRGPLSVTLPGRALDAMAAFIKANPTIKIEVHAFADDTGGPARRRAESKARADELRAYLVKAGVDPARVTAVPRGADRPAVRDRIVQFVVTGGAIVSTRPPSPPPPPPASGATPTDRAKRSYELGEQAYSRGDYDTAIAHFEASRREVPHAALLFNIGQAYKQKGDKATAISYFEQHLQEAPQNAKRVQPLIDALRNSP